MKEAMHFYFDGLYSVDMGLINCSMDTGFYEETFLAERSLQEDSVRGRANPYFQGVSSSPLTFDLTFAFEDGYDEEHLRKVARWLNVDYYKPFYTEANPEHIYYCMPVSGSQLFHNGGNQGYIRLTMRCDGPYAYSPKYTSRLYEWDESPIRIEQSAFKQGTLNGVILNQLDKITLDPQKRTWASVPANKRWID
ncbi:phage tail domain-containing protein [Paenibacillus sp. RC84]|uniref:phage tail domain-containing protein n=1 Tax=Paenibacillus sp. RC84 TaxID=3156252 RepID=UPI00351754B9